MTALDGGLMTAAERRRQISKNLTEATTDLDTRRALREIATVLDQAGITIRDRASESWTPEILDRDTASLGKRVAGAIARENESRRDIPDCLGYVLRNRLQTVTARASDAQRIAGLRAAVKEKAAGVDQHTREVRTRIAAARERLAFLHASPERVTPADVAWLLGEIDHLHVFEEQVGRALAQWRGSVALIDAAAAVRNLADARFKAAEVRAGRLGAVA